MKKLLLLIGLLLAPIAYASAQEFDREQERDRDSEILPPGTERGTDELRDGLKAGLPKEYGDITGRIVDRQNRKPIQNARVTIWTMPEVTVVTDANGRFHADNLPYGTHRITIEANEFLLTDSSVRINLPERDINVITMSPDTGFAELMDDMFSEFDFEGAEAQPLPVTLSASKDAFNNVAGYKFGALRFRTRGYDTGTQDVYLNGIKMNDAMNGYSPWSLWSGLNEATRNQEAVFGLATSDFGIGGVNGITNIDARASSLRQGFRASVVGANAQYMTRLMATYSSGILDNGWAFAASASLRYGPNFIVDGVYYNAWGYYVAAEKIFNQNQRLSFTFMGVPTKRGAQMGATDEAYELLDNYYYNPNWGYQTADGGDEAGYGNVKGRSGLFNFLDQRNARVRNYHEPIAIVNYTHDFSERTRLSAAASFRFGKNGYSALDWYKGADPKPDYYRNLPGYQTVWAADNKNDADKQSLQTEYWANNTWGVSQIDWRSLYNFNRNMGSQEDPMGNPAGRAYYIVSERHTDQRDLNLNATISHEIDQYSRINGGVAFRANRTEYYTMIKDLLGGDYFLNVDNFADRDDAGGENSSDGTGNWTWNNLRETSLESRMKRKGDKFGYDYYGFTQSARLWAMYTYTRGHWEGQAALEAGYSSLHRQGLYQKGLFPDDSYGKSDREGFPTYMAKLSGTYKISAAQNIKISGVATQKAPYFQNVFISPRTRNAVAENLKAEKVFGGEIAYSLRTPWLTLRLSGFYTQFKDQTKLISAYDDIQRAFTNLFLSGMDQRHIGGELGFTVPIVGGLSVSGAVSYGDYIYNSNPLLTQTIDNSARTVVDGEKIYYKGLKVENTPQFAANISLNYRTESYWFFELDASYFDGYYLSMNPLRRSESVDLLLSNLAMGDKAMSNPDQAKVQENIKAKKAAMHAQEKFHPAVVMNASIGKSWAFDRKYYLGFSLQIKNLLGYVDTPYTKNIRTGGFEQLRLYREQVDTIKDPVTDQRFPVYDYTPFDSKYFYLFPTNFYLNIYFRF